MGISCFWLGIYGVIVIKSFVHDAMCFFISKPIILNRNLVCGSRLGEKTLPDEVTEAHFENVLQFVVYILPAIDILLAVFVSRWNWFSCICINWSLRRRNGNLCTNLTALDGSICVIIATQTPICSMAEGLRLWFWKIVKPQIIWGFAARNVYSRHSWNYNTVKRLPNNVKWNGTRTYTPNKSCESEFYVHDNK